MESAATTRSQVAALKARVTTLEMQVAENARYKLLFEAVMRFVPDGIVIAEGPDVRITHVSVFGQELTGRPRESIEGIDAPDHVARWGVLHPDGRPATPEELPLTRACRNGEITADEEWILVRADGSKITILCNAAPIRDENGNLTGGLLAWRNITARKKAETALREAEERLLSVLQAANMVGWDWNVSTGKAQHYGDLRSVIGQHYTDAETFFALIHPEDRDSVNHLLHQHIAHGDPYRTDFRLLLPDGSVRWIRDCGSRVIDQATGDTHMAGIAADITAVKEAERQLAAQQRFTADLITAAPTITYVFDVHARSNILISEQCFDVLGYTPVEIQAMGSLMLQILLHPDDMPRAIAMFEAMSQEPGKVFELEYRMRHKDGHYVWIFSRDRLIDDHRLLGVALDITSRRQTEQALREANAELTHFAYSVSHDLREPLRMIHTYSQLIGRRYADKMDPEVLRMFSYITDGARRMDRTIEGLLQFGRATHTDLHAVHTDATEALRGVVADLASRIQDAGAQVTVVSDLPPVLCLPNGLALILQNLIANAIAYARPGIAPHIDIGATPGPKFHTFCVRDNGRGIPKEHHSSIFGMFARLHGNELPGNGIGLATVRRIVDRSGGRIWVESTPGEGSAFSFTLPAASG